MMKASAFFTNIPLEQRRLPFPRTASCWLAEALTMRSMVDANQRRGEFHGTRALNQCGRVNRLVNATLPAGVSVHFLFFCRSSAFSMMERHFGEGCEVRQHQKQFDIVCNLWK
jgi:hypothetical protein